MDWAFFTLVIGASVVVATLIVTVATYVHNSNQAYTKQLEAQVKQLEAENAILRKQVQRRR